jgi:hypothetical protein
MSQLAVAVVRLHLIGKYRKFETSLCLNSANKSKFGEVTFSRTVEAWVQYPRGAQSNLRFLQQLSGDTDVKPASL